jgi:hypothetical protein
MRTTLQLHAFDWEVRITKLGHNDIIAVAMASTLFDEENHIDSKSDNP